MKKVFYFSVLALTVSALTLSCNKTAVEEPAQEEIVTPVTRTFTCTFAESDTKVAIDDATGKTTWKVGDQIMIRGRWTGQSGDKYYSRVVTLDSGNILNDGKTASFDVEEITSTSSGKTWTKGKTSLFAIYPANTVVIDNGKNSWYESTPFNTTNAPLVAGYNNLDVNDGASFTLYNLCGILSFKVGDGYDSYVFEGNNSETVGYDNYQAALYMDSAPSLTWVKSGSAITSISGTVVGDKSTVNCIYFPNGATFSNGFTIKFKKDGAIVKTLSTTKSVTIARNEYRPMGDVTDYLKDYVAPTSHNNTIVADISSVTDLSASETANCYIVDGSVAANAGKVFKFKAAKGKGGAVLTNIGGDENKDVVVLWETKNTSTAPNAGDIIAAVDYDMQEGEEAYIVFKMPDTITPGNALIAAKDAAGTILWSWHIWVPETAITSNTFGGITDKAMMSRNLGALVDAEASSETPIAVESQGLLYQWGRKDPFPNSVTFGNNGTAAAVSGTISWNGEMVASTDVYKYPNVFIKTGVDDDAHKDWSTDHLNSLWGETKTVYDPCPPGYKVPSVGDGGIWNVNANLTTMTGWESNTTNHWFKVGSAVFPYAGYVQQEDAAYRYPGARAHYHTATGGSSAYNAILYGAPDVKYTEKQRKGRAGSVRCVAEAKAE